MEKGRKVSITPIQKEIYKGIADLLKKQLIPFYSYGYRSRDNDEMFIYFFMEGHTYQMCIGVEDVSLWKLKNVNERVFTHPIDLYMERVGESLNRLEQALVKGKMKQLYDRGTCFQVQKFLARFNECDSGDLIQILLMKLKGNGLQDIEMFLTCSNVDVSRSDQSVRIIFERLEKGYRGIKLVERFRTPVFPRKITLIVKRK